MKISAGIGIALLAVSCGGDFSLNQTQITWHLQNCNNVGTMQCGFAATCGMANATSLTFTVVDENNPSATKTTSTSCPAAESSGTVSLNLPSAGGPFTISARVDGLPSSSSVYGCHIAKDEGYNLIIYYLGCGDSNCTTCR